MEDSFGLFCPVFDKLLEETKEWLLEFDSEKRLKIIREILKNPHYDRSDVYILCLNEYQTSPPVPRNPVRIRFPMKEQQPIEPATKEKNNTVKKSENRGRMRARDEDWNGDEERKGREKKIKKVNQVVLPEKNHQDLPEELRDRIRRLNGTDVIMVMEKELYETDVNTNNGRLSLPSRQIDMGFLSEEEKLFLATELPEEGRKLPRIRSRIIGEGGMDHEIYLCKWIMPKPKSVSKNVSEIYNLVSGWNDVLKAHKLSKHTIVQLWSFRVEGNLRFALVKL